MSQTVMNQTVPPLSHFDAEGHAHMVDVTDKTVTSRSATAEAFVHMTPATLALALSGQAEKGDVLGIARLAGIMAAKRTADLIPLCHPLPLSKVALTLAPAETGAETETGAKLGTEMAAKAISAIHITATVRTTGRTGVEMEALTAVSVAALTVYDMLKAAEKSIRIDGIRLLVKEGGKSGRYQAAP